MPSDVIFEIHVAATPRQLLITGAKVAPLGLAAIAGIVLATERASSSFGFFVFAAITVFMSLSMIAMAVPWGAYLYARMRRLPLLTIYRDGIGMPTIIGTRWKWNDFVADHFVQYGADLNTELVVFAPRRFSHRTLKIFNTIGHPSATGFLFAFPYYTLRSTFAGKRLLDRTAREIFEVVENLRNGTL